MTTRRRNTLPTSHVSALILLILFSGCAPKNQVNPNLSATMPQKIIWAWERPEDLRFLDPKEYGVAFLAQTILLEKDVVNLKPRRQPLKVSPDAYLIAVTRIETEKDGHKRPTLSAEMASKIVRLVGNTLELPDVKAVQIDFDAVVSERAFYRQFMFELHKDLETRADRSVRIPLTMTSLASWCVGDAWFNDFPVDEAVPMAFEMGADSDNIRNFLRNANDWNEPLCRGSYGISLEEGRFEGMKPGRRLYLFKNNVWTAADREVLTFSVP